MPILLLFAIVPALLLISLAVLLIGGAVTLLTGRNQFNKNDLIYNSARGAFDSVSDKINEAKKVYQAKKVKDIHTVDVIILKEK